MSTEPPSPDLGGAPEDRTPATTVADADTSKGQPPGPGPGRRPTLFDVARGYKLFLGREIESVAMAAFHIGNAPDLWDLVETIWSCPEAQHRRTIEVLKTLPDLHRQKTCDPKASAAQLEALYRTTLEAWRLRGLGRFHEALAPTHATFTARSARWDLDALMGRGNAEAAALWQTLARLEWNRPAEATVLALGVKTFRLTEACRQADARLIGVEWLPSDRDRARQAQASSDQPQADFYSVGEFRDHDGEADLLYCVDALQYAPPPVSLDLLRLGFQRLRTNGIAVFQLPAQLHDYAYATDDYLDGAGQDICGELHCVPQPAVLRLLAEAGLTLLEVQPDHRIGPYGLSYLYVARKGDLPMREAPQRPIAT